MASQPYGATIADAKQVFAAMDECVRCACSKSMVMLQQSRKRIIRHRAGVCRPCIETELTATEKSATLGRHKRAYDRIQLVADSC